jgi:hypothetical protein
MCPVQLRLAVRVPEHCVSCSAIGSVSLEQTIRGTSIALNWSCSKCGHTWPVAPGEEHIDRRFGDDDRRGTARGDRRRRPKTDGCPPVASPSSD